MLEVCVKRNCWKIKTHHLYFVLKDEVVYNLYLQFIDIATSRYMIMMCTLQDAK